MSYVLLDLEWNGSYSKLLHKYVNEIIEFGAIKVDDELNITDKFSLLVTPQIGKKLCSKVKELTKITNEELENNGVGFIKALKMFSDFVGDSALLTWSDSDLHALIDNYSYYTGEVKLPFLKNYCNLQRYCENCLDIQNSSAQLGLAACAEMTGIEFSVEEQHRAYADALLSLECLAYFKSKYPLEPFIINADNADFYNRLLFKNHFITDINSPEIDHNHLVLCCDKCGKKAIRKTKWRIHNKSFNAEFYCEDCNRKLLGRVSFKKKFDEIIVKKKILEKTARKTENKIEDNNINN